MNTASVMSAPTKLAPLTLASTKSAPCRLVFGPEKFAAAGDPRSDRSAPSKDAPAALTFVKLAPARVASGKLALVSVAPSSLVPVRSSGSPRKSSAGQVDAASDRRRRGPRDRRARPPLAHPRVDVPGVGDRRAALRTRAAAPGSPGTLHRCTRTPTSPRRRRRRGGPCWRCWARLAGSSVAAERGPGEAGRDWNCIVSKLAPWRSVPANVVRLVGDACRTWRARALAVMVAPLRSAPLKS